MWCHWAVMSSVMSSSQRGELAQSTSQLVSDLTNQRAERRWHHTAVLQLAPPLHPTPSSPVGRRSPVAPGKAASLCYSRRYGCYGNDSSQLRETPRVELHTVAMVTPCYHGCYGYCGYPAGRSSCSWGGASCTSCPRCWFFLQTADGRNLSPSPPQPDTHRWGHAPLVLKPRL